MTELRSTDEIFIKKLTDIVLDNLANTDFTVKDLANASGMSLYSLSRRLHSVSRKIVNQFIREIRLQKALELLQSEDITASEAAYKTGFGSPVYFNKCFHDYYGYPPGMVKKSSPVDIGTKTVEGNVIEKIPSKSDWKSYILTFRGLVIIVLLVIVTGFFVYRNFFKPDVSDKLLSADGRISVAVMPFRNMTNDTTWNIWQDGIQEYLTGALANTKELKVRHKDNINTLIQTEGITKIASITPEFAGRISRKLDAGLFVYGTILKSDSITKLQAQLIGTKTNEVLRSFEIDVTGEKGPDFQILDTLRKRLTEYLIINKLIKQNPVYSTLPLSTNSSEAFRCYLLGDQANENGERETAISWYLKTLEIDSGFFEPMLRLSSLYAGMGMQTENLEWVLRYYNKRNHWSYPLQIAASWSYACSFESPEEQIKYLKQGEQIEDMDPSVHFMIGLTYNSMKQYDKAIQEFIRYFEISKKWFGKESYKDLSYYTNLGLAYHKTGQFKIEKDLYKLAERYILESPWLMTLKAVLAFSENDTIAAKREIDRYITYKKKISSTEADITLGIGDIYSQAGFLDKAEECYRKALALEPDKPEKVMALANFLMENKIDLDDVQQLMDKAIALASDSVVRYNCYDTKGWAKYLQGRNVEALAILQETWDNAPFKLYTYRSHLEEVKKAVPGIK